MTKLEFCLNHCPHAEKSCENRPCEEYRRRFSKKYKPHKPKYKVKDGA